MVKRKVTKRWYVRFHDGEEYDAQPGEQVTVLAKDPQDPELLVQFDGRHRHGWFSQYSVLFHSDRTFEDEP